MPAKQNPLTASRTKSLTAKDSGSGAPIKRQQTAGKDSDGVPGGGRFAGGRRPLNLADDFAEPIEEYRFGNWGNRFCFLPPVLGPGADRGAERDSADREEVVRNRMRSLVMSGNVNGVKMLLHSSVNVNNAIDEVARRTPLHFAALRNDVIMCQVLLRFNADPMMPDAVYHAGNKRVGQSCLEIAAEKEYLPLVALFKMHAPGFAEEDQTVNETRFETPKQGGQHHFIHVPLCASEPGFMNEVDTKFALTTGFG